MTREHQKVSKRAKKTLATWTNRFAIAAVASAVAACPYEGDKDDSRAREYDPSAQDGTGTTSSSTSGTSSSSTGTGTGGQSQGDPCSTSGKCTLAFGTPECDACAHAGPNSYPSIEGVWSRGSGR